MMIRMRIWTGAALLLGCILPSFASADVVERSAQGVVLPADGSDRVKVALRFDLSGLKRGSGMTVQTAFIEWEIPVMPEDRKTSFEAYRLTGSWGRLGPDALDVINALDSEPEATRDVYPQDITRTGRRLMRLNVAPLAQEILDADGSGLSVVVTMTNVPRQAVLEGLGNVHLKVRYGFLGNLAPLFRTGY